MHALCSTSRACKARAWPAAGMVRWPAVLRAPGAGLLQQLFCTMSLCCTMMPVQAMCQHQFFVMHCVACLSHLSAPISAVCAAAEWLCSGTLPLCRGILPLCSGTLPLCSGTLPLCNVGALGAQGTCEGVRAAERTRGCRGAGAA